MGKTHNIKYLRTHESLYMFETPILLSKIITIDQTLLQEHPPKPICLMLPLLQ